MTGLPRTRMSTSSFLNTFTPLLSKMTLLPSSTTRCPLMSVVWKFSKLSACLACSDNPSNGSFVRCLPCSMPPLATRTILYDLPRRGRPSSLRCCSETKLLSAPVSNVAKICLARLRMPFCSYHLAIDLVDLASIACSALSPRNLLAWSDGEKYLTLRCRLKCTVASLRAMSFFARRRSVRVALPQFFAVCRMLGPGRGLLSWLAAIEDFHLLVPFLAMSVRSSSARSIWRSK